MSYTTPSERHVIRLKRIFNCMNSKARKRILGGGFFLLAVGLLWALEDPSALWGMLIFIPLCFLANGIQHIIFSPKELIITNEALQFEDFVPISSGTYAGSTMNYKPTKVFYSIYKIQNLQFYQTPFEKQFNVGHISFSGKTVISASVEDDKIREKKTYYIYGIPNFSETEFLISRLHGKE